MAITDFIKTERPIAELAVALAVIREFKNCENDVEWVAVPFFAWAKLEQLEEFLAHKVDGEPLAADTLAYIESQGNQT